jgi:hypothetical protein
MERFKRFCRIHSGNSGLVQPCAIEIIGFPQALNLTVHLLQLCLIDSHNKTPFRRLMPAAQTGLCTLFACFYLSNAIR